MNQLKRIMALLLVLLLVGLVFLTIYFAVTGSPYFMASMYTMLALPLLLYAFWFVYKMVHHEDEER